MSDYQDDLLESEETLEEQEAAQEVNGEKAASSVSSTISKSAKKKAPALKGSKHSNDPMEHGEKGVVREETDEDEEEEDEDEMEESYDFSEDLDALVASEATLSEGFRDKAGLIFEAAVSSKVEAMVSQIDEAYQEQLVEEVASIQEELVGKVDSYLNYVVESWMEDNQLAVESGLRADIAESFMTSLQSVFAEHYIEVPEGREDLVDSLAERVEELESSLNDTIAENVEMKEQLVESVRASVLRDASDSLSKSQAEKLSSLVENVEFTSIEGFEAQVATLKESYFGAKKVIAEEVVADGEVSEDQGVSPRMQSYLAALRKS